MIVTKDQFEKVIQELEVQNALALDTECFGLRPFHGDTFFSIIIATAMEAFYMNFKSYPDAEGVEQNLILTQVELETLHRRVLLGKSDRLWYFHNFKYDAHMLATKNLGIRGNVHDTKVAARVLRNDHFDYTLEACTARIGLKKSDAVEKYILEKGLWDWERIPGKKTRVKNYFFSEVPFAIMSEYGETDARITFDLGDRQLCELAKLDLELRPGQSGLGPLASNESRLLHTVYHMERTGVLLDKPYCMAAIRHESARMDTAGGRWRELTGQADFKDSPATGFRGALSGSQRRSKTGRESFDAEALELLAASSPAAQVVLDFRDAKKRLDFFHGFLHHADTASRIHPNLDSAGTVTGRFSCSQPNLQQLTKDEDLSSAFPIRRALVPTPGYFFVMLDYDQQEYRIMLDYAGIYTKRRELIEKVKGGLDVHQATADVAGISRPAAKTTNFSILFGAGLDLLAARLRLPRAEAHRVKRSVLDSAPEIQSFLDNVAQAARQRGYVSNWYGRRWYCPNPQFAYKAPNFLCQGGGADVLKVAMNRIDDYLRSNDCRSRLILQVHDELVLEVHESEREVVPACKAIMEKVYKYNYLPLTVGADFSEKSFADKKEWAG